MSGIFLRGLAGAMAGRTNRIRAVPGAMAIGCAVCFLSASPTIASLYVATYSGTLASGYDAMGIFGSRYQSLAGAPFSTSFTYDTSLPGARSGCCGYDTVSGFSPSPVVSASITVNGVSHYFLPFSGSAATSSVSGHLRHGAIRDYDSNAYYSYMLDVTTAEAYLPTAPGNLEQNVAGVAVSNVYNSQLPSFQITRLARSGKTGHETTYGNYGSLFYTVSGVDTVHDGLTAATPLLPGSTTAAGFGFTVGVTSGQTVYIDPAIATGYDYQVTSGPNIQSALFPVLAGDANGYDVYGWDSITQLYDIGLGHATGGVNFDFGTLGVSRFGLRGIDIAAALDSGDANAFVTGLTFAGTGAVHVDQKPFVAAAVPEPSSWAIMLMGFGVVGCAMRRRPAVRFSFA